MKIKKQFLKVKNELMPLALSIVIGLLKFLIYVLAMPLFLILIVCAIFLSSCATKSTEAFQCTQRVQTPCMMPILEPELFSEKSQVIKENGLRWIECQEKVIMLLEDFKQCSD